MNGHRYVVIFALAFSLVLGGCAFVTIPLISQPQPLEEQVIEGDGPEKILILTVSGIISEDGNSDPSFLREPSIVEEITEALKKARQDTAIKGVVLRINSPGGSVTASDILYHELNSYRKATGSKIIACLTDLGASGGYYVATAADEIIAHPTTIAGSISVIAVKFDIKGLLDLVGIKEETVKSGRLKDIWSPFRPSTDEERQIMQGVIDSFHQRFVNVIAAGRPQLTREEIERLADGRIFTADQALESKLVDSVGYMDDAIDRLKLLLGVASPKIITYARPGTYRGTIYSEAPHGLSGQIKVISHDGGTLRMPPRVQVMYLWMP
jgi:protease-4